LYKYLNIFIVAYLDNILIFSKILTKYIKYIKKILDKIKQARLLIKPGKYKFYKKELKFLEYIIRENRIRINKEKVKAILK
ncbi:hypothetical protein OIDMADRAFT_116225, partial [Oidiodendron maius Zn]